MMKAATVAEAVCLSLVTAGWEACCDRGSRVWIGTIKLVSAMGLNWGYRHCAVAVNVIEATVVRKRLPGSGSSVALALAEPVGESLSTTRDGASCNRSFSGWVRSEELKLAVMVLTIGWVLINKVLGWLIRLA